MPHTLSFISEEERLAHPQAKLIPKAAWSEFYNNGLEESYLTLMQEQFENLLETITSLPVLQQRNKALWLALIVSYPQFVEEIEVLAQYIKPAKTKTDINEFLLEVAIYANSNKLSLSIMASYNPNELYNVVTDGKIIKALVKTGAFYILYFLKERLEKDLFSSIISQIIHHTYISAINAGNLSILRFLDKKISAYSDVTTRFEIGFGYWIFLNYLKRYESYLFARDFIKAKILDSIDEAGKNPDSSIFQFVDQAIHLLVLEEVTDHIWQNKIAREELQEERRIRQYSDFKTILPDFNFIMGRNNVNDLEIHCSDVYYNCDQFSSNDNSAFDEYIALEGNTGAVNYPPLYRPQAVHFNDHLKEPHYTILQSGQKSDRCLSKDLEPALKKSKTSSFGSFFKPAKKNEPISFASTEITKGCV